MQAPEPAPLRVVMVAGEVSGDVLGATVLAVLREAYGAVEATGIGGPLMQAQGLHSLYAQDRLAVMGLVEPLGRLPELLGIRRALYRHCCEQPPDLFLGIYSPDFNLGLERRLRARGIPTAHLVSPSVWAWRRSRLRGIARAVDMMLCLFPFEVPVYQQAGIPARYVGHPLAMALAPPQDRAALRAELGLDPQRPVLGLFPGSRAAEVKQHGALFLDAAAQVLAARPGLQLVLMAASSAREQQLRALLHTRPQLPVTLMKGRSRDLLGAADSVLLASGTVALEAMLRDTPMVVAYRMAPLSWAVISRLVYTPFASLPNILAGRAVVPEWLQSAATPSALAGSLLSLLPEPGAASREAQAQRASFAEQRCALRQSFPDAVLAALQAGPLRPGAARSAPGD
jgi:lipid-A-disaccharide synthase